MSPAEMFAPVAREPRPLFYVRSEGRGRAAGCMVVDGECHATQMDRRALLCLLRQVAEALEAEEAAHL